MLPIFIYTTVFFWVISLLQISLIPFWAGDYVFILLFVWSLFIAQRFEKIRSVWILWAPPMIGLGMASFIFLTLSMLLPYLITLVILTLILTKKIKWIFRFKEGFSYCVLLLFTYFVSVVLVRSEFMNYQLNVELLIRFILTFILTIAIWAYFSVRSMKVRIR